MLRRMLRPQVASSQVILRLADLLTADILGISGNHGSLLLGFPIVKDENISRSTSGSRYVGQLPLAHVCLGLYLLLYNLMRDHIPCLIGYEEGPGSWALGLVKEDVPPPIHSDSSKPRITKGPSHPRGDGDKALSLSLSLKTPKP